MTTVAEADTLNPASEYEAARQEYVNRVKTRIYEHLDGSIDDVLDEELHLEFRAVAYDPEWDDVELRKTVLKHLRYHKDFDWFLEILSEFCDENAEKERGTGSGMGMVWADRADKLRGTIP